MSLRLRAGALLYDWPRFEWQMRTGHWLLVRNRGESIESDGRGVRCCWQFTSDLHIAKVFPSTGRRLFRAAFSDWPIVLADAPVAGAKSPSVSFVIGHRGLERLPLLLMTLRSIAGQSIPVECIVVEQSAEREIEPLLPAWVRYVHTPTALREYSRSWAFNAGVRSARGALLVLHDNDMMVPARFAEEALARRREGHEFLDLKRFIFYTSREQSETMIRTGDLAPVAVPTIVQNSHGGSVIASREAYDRIGGFDETFLGWGGEDNEFRERAESAASFYPYGYLPLVHLHHAAQPGKLQGSDAPAIRRYRELSGIPARERIARLVTRRRGEPGGPNLDP